MDKQNFQLVTAKEAAKLCGVDVITFRQWVNKGHFDTARVRFDSSSRSWYMVSLLGECLEQAKKPFAAKANVDKELVKRMNEYLEKKGKK